MIEDLINKINKKKIWHYEPVFCFTSDIDWASDAVMRRFIETLPIGLRPTFFVTHESDVVKSSGHDVGIHPNFLPGSSHGDSFVEVIKSCLKFAPDCHGVRSHRAFEVTDTSHLLSKTFGFRYSSNTVTIMQDGVVPVLHESGLVNFPVFWEDGTHLYNDLNLRIPKYLDYFESPGIKVISIHPMHYVFNSPTFRYMREIKDMMTRIEYHDIGEGAIMNLANNSIGIRHSVQQIVAIARNHQIMSLKELYEEAIS